MRMIWITLALAACGTSALLGPDAEQGIDGTVLLGPMCPVQSVDNPCPDRPYQATIDVLDDGGNRVTTVDSDGSGHFKVGLEPGSYRLHPNAGEPLPRASDQDVTVHEGVWAVVTVSYDTGIR